MICRSIKSRPVNNQLEWEVWSESFEVEVKDPVKRVTGSKRGDEEDGGGSNSEFDSKEEERKGASGEEEVGAGEGDEDDGDNEEKESGKVELAIVRGLCFQKEMTAYRNKMKE